MNYLEELGFNKDQINRIYSLNHPLVIDKISKNPRLLKKNLMFLKDLGVSNYKEIFIEYAEVFLQDSSVFKEIFLMYDREDLIEKLKRNMAIIVRL